MRPFTDMKYEDEIAADSFSIAQTVNYSLISPPKKEVKCKMYKTEQQRHIAPIELVSATQYQQGIN